MRYVLTLLLIFGFSSTLQAVEFNHYFNKDSIKIKPNRSDYDSDEAYAADLAVHLIPRICSWYTSYDYGGARKNQKGKVDDFQVGANLRKSVNSDWYALSVTPRSGTGGAFRQFLFVNPKTSQIACGNKGLNRLGGTWSDGKWFKFFELAMKTKPSGKASSDSGSNRTTGETVAALSAKILCRRAVKVTAGKASWEESAGWKPTVDEAIRRGFSPEDCAKMTGQTVTVQKQPKEDGLSKGVMERLNKLKKLLDAGLIDKSDYDKKKDEILKDL